jgi:hypothetical protein
MTSKLYFLDTHGSLHVTCAPSDPEARAFGPGGSSRPASNIELGILNADTLVGAEAIEASDDHRLIERPDGWQIVVTRFCKIAAGSGTLWDEDPGGDGFLWWCKDGSSPVALKWGDDRAGRGWAEYRTTGFALQIDPAAGACWVSER